MKNGIRPCFIVESNLQVLKYGGFGLLIISLTGNDTQHVAHCSLKGKALLQAREIKTNLTRGGESTAKVFHVGVLSIQLCSISPI